MGQPKFPAARPINRQGSGTRSQHQTIRSLARPPPAAASVTACPTPPKGKGVPTPTRMVTTTAVVVTDDVLSGALSGS
jgi:hypothetical protein